MASGDPPHSLLIKEEECIKNWKEILSKEEIYWKQRSRIQWLKEGDINSAFFNHSTSIHKKRNLIKFLKDDTGQEITDKAQIGKTAIDFFIYMYIEFRRGNESLQDRLLRKLPNAIGEEDNCQLLSPISLKEVCLTIFVMGAYKTSGPDGFPLTFFQ